jgi:Protein of unknown function (DUF3300)
MNLHSRSLIRRSSRTALAAVTAIAIGGGDAYAYVWVAPPPIQQAASSQVTAAISPDQLDSLVAPVALYPDPLLAQVLAASTYPLEIMQLQQWLTKHQGLTGQALANAVQQEPWDPSVQAMAVLPDVVKRLTDDIQWTTDLGNAFLAQESGVMDAVQRMRRKAEATGGLTSTSQQVVETRVIENKSVIVIEPSSPDTIYVPSYNPVVVYGPPVYPYPSIYYPSAGQYAAGAAISFGLGVATAAFWGHGGGWGWRPGWGHNDITINRNNTFIRNSPSYRSGSINTWQHNAVRRSGNVSTYRGAATGTSGVSRTNTYRGSSSTRSYSGSVNRGSVTGSRSGSVSGSRSGTVSGYRSGSVSGSRGGSVSGSRSGSISGTRGGSVSGSRSGSVGGSRGGGGHRGGGGGRRR